MIKVIFSDMDGTLLSSKKDEYGKIISNGNLKAIQKAQEKGIKFVFCTGRLPFGFGHYMDLIHSYDYIGSNGSVVASNGKLIKGVELDKEVRKTILNFGIENNLYERIFCLDYLYLLNPELGGDDVNFYKTSRGVSHDEALNIINNNKIYKMSFHHESFDFLKEIRERVSKLNLNAEICFASTAFLEINPKGQHKGQGLLDYCRYYNIDPSEVLAIGDNENDITMLQTSGISACPNNSIEEVKAISDYVCVNDCDHDAIEEVIEKYIL